MLRAAAGLAVITLTIAAVVIVAPPVSAETVHIESSNLYFCDPSYQGGVCETTITAGDTVVWDNVSGTHTVTECNSDFSVCPPAGGFDSGFLGPGDTFTHTFEAAGTFPYWCALHPIEMRGRIIVQEATPTPSPTSAPTAEPTPTPEGQTPSPAPSTTPTPGAIPGAGGVPGDGPLFPFTLVLAGVVATVIGAGVAMRLVSRD